MVTSLQLPDNDPDFDVEAELPPLDQAIPKDRLKRLKPKDKKRQEVINGESKPHNNVHDVTSPRIVVVVLSLAELFYTERNHVRNLKIMFRVYYANMLKQSIPVDFLRLLFPNLEELILIHQELKAAFVERKKQDAVVSRIGDILVERVSRAPAPHTCSHFML